MHTLWTPGIKADDYCSVQERGGVNCPLQGTKYYFLLKANRFVTVSTAIRVPLLAMLHDEPELFL